MIMMGAVPNHELAGVAESSEPKDDVDLLTVGAGRDRESHSLMSNTL